MFKYIVIRNAIDKQTCDLVKTSLHMSREILYKLHNKSLEDKSAFGDGLVKDSFSIEYHGTCEALLVTMQPVIENIVNKRLFPTTSYARIYSKGSVLKPHVDRESCEYSVTICVENNPTPWAIFMDGNEVLLNQGDMVVYKGCELQHWRKELTEDTEVTQVFLHYVDQDGPNAEFKFDRRPMLGIPPRVLQKI